MVPLSFANNGQCGTVASAAVHTIGDSTKGISIQDPQAIAPNATDSHTNDQAQPAPSARFVLIQSHTSQPDADWLWQRQQPVLHASQEDPLRGCAASGWPERGTAQASQACQASQESSASQASRPSSGGSFRGCEWVSSLE